MSVFVSLWMRFGHEIIWVFTKGKYCVKIISEMKILRLYFDTSIFSFAIASDVPKEKEITLKLLEEIEKSKCEVFISEVVIREINRAKAEKAVKLRDVVKKLNPVELVLDNNSQSLAKEYIKQAVIPVKYEDDAFHIAIASVNNLDVIVSWNFTHIVKLKTKREVVGINTLMGYKPIEICSPWEVVEDV